MNRGLISQCYQGWTKSDPQRFFFVLGNVWQILSSNSCNMNPPQKKQMTSSTIDIPWPCYCCTKGLLLADLLGRPGRGSVISASLLGGLSGVFMCFPLGTPIAGWFDIVEHIMENPIKVSGWWLGVPLFQETTIFRMVGWMPMTLSSVFGESLWWNSWRNFKQHLPTQEPRE